MVRSTHFMHVIESEKLIENARVMGEYMVKSLQTMAAESPIITAVRGRGLFIAFDLPDSETRDELWKGLFDQGVLVLKSGERAIRFRPALDISAQVVDEAMELIGKQCQRMGGGRA
jgi:L-lysine 6-transaminase